MRYNIYSDGEKINTIVSDEEFCKKYCEKNSYTYELVEESVAKPVVSEPSVNDILNVLLGVTE